MTVFIKKAGIVVLLACAGLMSGCVSTPVEEENTIKKVAPPPVKQDFVQEAVAEVPVVQATQQPNFKEGDANRELPEKYSGFYATMDGVRLDLSVVIQALYHRLQNNSTAGGDVVLFSDEVVDLSDGTGFSYTGFALSGISIRRDEAASASPFHRRMEALLMLSDVWGRQASVVVSADYLIGDDQIFIRQAAALPYYSGLSDLRFLVVPAARMVSFAALKHLPLTELYRLAGENGLTEDELTSLSPLNGSRYYLVVFDMVRGEENERLKLYLSGDQTLERAQSSNRVLLNEHGWSATVVDGHFQFNSTPSYTFHVAKSGRGELLEVGRFESVFGRY